MQRWDRPGCREAGNIKDDSGGVHSENSLCAPKLRLGCTEKGEPMPVKELADRVASYVHLCTLCWWPRPFGCGVILGGYARDGLQLYMIEPSGLSYVNFLTLMHKCAFVELHWVKENKLLRRQSIFSIALTAKQNSIAYLLYDFCVRAYPLSLSLSSQGHTYVEHSLCTILDGPIKTILTFKV